MEEQKQDKTIVFIGWVIDRWVGLLDLLFDTSFMFLSYDFKLGKFFFLQWILNMTLVYKFLMYGWHFGFHNLNLQHTNNLTTNQNGFFLSQKVSTNHFLPIDQWANGLLCSLMLAPNLNLFSSQKPSTPQLKKVNWKNSSRKIKLKNKERSSQMVY